MTEHGRSQKSSTSVQSAARAIRDSEIHDGYSPIRRRRPGGVRLDLVERACAICGNARVTDPLDPRCRCLDCAVCDYDDIAASYGSFVHPCCAERSARATRESGVFLRQNGEARHDEEEADEPTRRR